MKKLYLESFNGNLYYRITHGDTLFYVSPNLVKTDEFGSYIEDPLTGCDIIQLKNNMFVIKEGGTKTLFYSATWGDIIIKSDNEDTVFKAVEEFPDGERLNKTLILTKQKKTKVFFEKRSSPETWAEILYENGRVDILPGITECVFEKL